jgi:hypothetical protein
MRISDIPLVRMLSAVTIRLTALLSEAIPVMDSLPKGIS